MTALAYENIIAETIEDEEYEFSEGTSKYELVGGSDENKKVVGVIACSGTAGGEPADFAPYRDFCVGPLNVMNWYAPDDPTPINPDDESTVTVTYTVGNENVASACTPPLPAIELMEDGVVADVLAAKKWQDTDGSFHDTYLP